MNPNINNAEYLRKRHHQDNISVRQLAKELNCSVSTINRKLKKFNIKKKKIAFKQNRKVKESWHPNLFNEEYLRKRHHQDKITLRNLSKELNCSRYKVTEQLRKYNIPIKNHHHYTKDVQNKINDPDWLYEMHYDKNMTITEIGRFIGVVPEVLFSKFREFNIPKRKNVVQKIQNVSEEFLIEEHHTHNKTLTEIAEDLGVSIASVSLWFKKWNIPVIDNKFSIGEKEVLDFVKSGWGGCIIENDRSLIGPKELDIYIPTKNLAIEYNGVYWHSEPNVGKTYHLEKTKECMEKGVQLLHIFSNEWERKKNIWKSMIRHRLGGSEPVYARILSIGKLSNNQAKDFYDENHLYGHCHCKYHYALFWNGDIMAVMSFSKSRFSTKYEYELVRFANRLNFRVVGGAQRLLRAFLRDNNVDTIGSYCDLRYSTGKLYEKLGFNYIHTTRPNYGYIVNGEIESRYRYQKDKLKIKLPNFDPRLSEVKNMINHGYYRIFDCGNMLFIYNNK